MLKNEETNLLLIAEGKIKIIYATAKKQVKPCKKGPLEASLFEFVSVSSQFYLR